MKIVNGASLKPRSGGQPKQIVLLLHGFGYSGHDMITLATSWQQSLPDALFLAPHAPQRCTAGAGYPWWGLSDISPRALALGAAGASPAIDVFIDRKLGQYALADADLAIVGFSQGTMMALHVGLRRADRVAAVVGYSGMLTGGLELEREIASKPPVLLVHGLHDSVVPVAALHDGETKLNQHLLFYSSIVPVRIEANRCNVNPSDGRMPADRNRSARLIRNPFHAVSVSKLLNNLDFVEPI